MMDVAQDARWTGSWELNDETLRKTLQAAVDAQYVAVTGDAERSEDTGRCRGRYTPQAMLQRLLAVTEDARRSKDDARDAGSRYRGRSQDAATNSGH